MFSSRQPLDDKQIEHNQHWRYCDKRKLHPSRHAARPARLTARIWPPGVLARTGLPEVVRTTDEVTVASLKRARIWPSPITQSKPSGPRLVLPLIIC
jgi:hypothetical protein